MRVKVLGSAAGGGFPQWNCGCGNCRRLRAGTFQGSPRTQTQVAISPSGSSGSWFLLNASPDLRQQILENPEFAPAGELRSTPIRGIILTCADVDCVMGLLHLREFQPLAIYGTESVRRVVTQENSLFRTLERSNPPVRWQTIPVGKVCELDGGFACVAVPLGGAFPDYVSATLRKDLADSEAAVALQISEGGKKLFYAPALPGRNEEWKLAARDSDLALLDGTFWTDDELVRLRGSGKSAREMGHLPLSGTGGLLDEMRDLNKPRRILIHLNNTNPVLDEESAEWRAVHEQGWEVAYDGMEISL
jgi:pyrroloquinoline quinone biosynthesis protein B